MNESKNTVGRKNARRLVAGACLTLAILAIAAGVPRLSHADAPSTPPVSQCSDFACEP